MISNWFHTLKQTMAYVLPSLEHILSFVSTLICTEIYFVVSYLSDPMDDWYFWMWWVYEKGENDTGVPDSIFVKKMTNLTGTGCVSHFLNSHQELLQAVSGTALSKNLSEESNARSQLSMLFHTEKLTNVWLIYLSTNTEASLLFALSLLN